MRYKIRQEKGITMVALVVTIITLLILTSILIYNAKDSIEIKKLTNLYNDIDLLREKVSAYYNEYGKIPAKIKYESLGELASVFSTKNDTGDFYVIDLEAMQGISLNYGKDYEKAKADENNVSNYKDIYIINQNSHNIFYVQGVNIKQNNTTKTYYTDYVEPDETTVDLRYIDGILIPDGYYYIGKYTDNSGNESIVISNIEGETVDTSKTNQYMWTKQIATLEDIPSSITLEENQEKYGFLNSVNINKGYFNNSVTGKVQYTIIDEEKWSEAYTEEKTYTDKNGDKVIIPKGFKVSMATTMNTVENGFVAKDSNDNEWVWITVPNTAFITATNNTDYENIEADLIEYAKDYREDGYSDDWYDGCGLTEEEYKATYQKMLSSIYTNSGFWIGRYEVGTEVARTTETTTLSTALIQKNIYPYNYVTCSQAQSLAKNIGTYENGTTSLLFGIQWDLVCKTLEKNTNLTKADITEDSSSWGNNNNSEFEINNTNAKYNQINLGQYTGWKNIAETIAKAQEMEMLLTSGASERNRKMNIYDFSGNQYEWTLEKSKNNDATYRGGYFHKDIDSGPVVYRSQHGITEKYGASGFRIALY